MKILTSFDGILKEKITAEVVSTLKNDTIVCYTEDDRLDFKTAKALAPILEIMELEEGEKSDTEMLMMATLEAYLDDKGRSCIFRPGDTAFHSIVMNGKKVEVKIAGSIDTIYASAGTAANVKTVGKKTQKKDEPVSDGNGTEVDEYAINKADIDKDTLDAFIDYLPEDVVPDDVTHETLAKALYLALSIATSDADVAAKLEALIGGQAEAIIAELKKRELYDELRNIAII